VKTSVIIPLKNEKENAEPAIRAVDMTMHSAGCPYEIIAVDDSDDGTWDILQSLTDSIPALYCTRGGEPAGLGSAWQSGIKASSGEILVFFNGDMSDNPETILTYIDLVGSGYDMVFGSRYMVGSSVYGGGFFKKWISRTGNRFLQLIFRLKCNDVTNSFKAYRREVLQAIVSASAGFAVAIETPLKAVLMGYSYTTVPISWSDRKHGQSHMRLLGTMFSYLRVVVVLLLQNIRGKLKQRNPRTIKKSHPG